MDRVDALTQATFFASRKDGQPTWAHALRTEADGETQDILKRPELVELRSLSHEGRVRCHRKVCLPPTQRPRKTQYRPPENEEQLLYVALYRDKIADHQAELETQKDTVKIQSPRRQRIRAAELAIAEKCEVVPSLGVMFPEVNTYEQPIGDTYGVDSPTWLNAGLSCPERGAAFWQTLAEASGANQVLRGQSGGSLRLASSPRRCRGSDPSTTPLSARATGNIASVPSNPGVGGVANEYLETKRLGKLFDEWKETQAEENQQDEFIHTRPRRTSNGKPIEVHNTNNSSDQVNLRSARLAAPSNASHPTAASPRESSSVQNAASMTSPTSSGKDAIVTPSSPKTKPGMSARRVRGRGVVETANGVLGGNPNPKTVGKPKAATRRRPSNLEFDSGDVAQMSTPRGSTENNQDFVDASGSDTSEHHGAQICESKLVSRLFQVMTNPKGTGQVASDSESSRKGPTHIEGFPTMNLMRLYKGPWRLDV